MTVTLRETRVREVRSRAPGHFAREQGRAGIHEPPHRGGAIERLEHRVVSQVGERPITERLVTERRERAVRVGERGEEGVGHEEILPSVERMF